MHHCLCHLQIILQIQSVIIPRMWLWVHTHLQHCSCDVKGRLSQRVLPSNTSASGAHHPPPLSSRSYAMTLNLDPLSIFCSENKSLLFLLHFRFHGSPWLAPIKTAVSTNEYVVQVTGRPAHWLTPSTLESHFTAAFHNKHMAVPNPTEAATAHRTYSIAHSALTGRRPDVLVLLPTCFA